MSLSKLKNKYFFFRMVGFPISLAILTIRFQCVVFKMFLLFFS